MATKTKPATKKAKPKPKATATATEPKAEAKAPEAKPELQVSKEAKAIVDEYKAGKRTQTSAVDELVALKYKVGEIAKMLDKPYRQMFNVKNRKRYSQKPSEREAEKAEAKAKK